MEKKGVDIKTDNALCLRVGGIGMGILSIADCKTGDE